MNAGSYHDELTDMVDAFLAEPVPEEATEEDREMLADIEARAKDVRRRETSRPPRKAVR